MYNKKVINKCLLIFTFASAAVSVSAKTDPKSFTDDKNFPSLLTSSAQSPALLRMADSLYNLIGLSSYGLEKRVFYAALKGYYILDTKGLLRKKNVLTICDYSQSSSNKRLYVIDVVAGRLLFNTYVSHGKNSGGAYATSFSNMVQSNKSSLGFMLTAETYSGKAGYSMRFDGMEVGVNDKVRARDIVLHGSNFVNARMVSERGAVGNSLGCPAVPNEKRKQIIDAIKGGTCFYVNHPDSWYARTSPILNTRFDLVPALVPSPNLQASTLSELSENNSGKATTNAASLY
jgi:hypothetical protein